MGSVRVPHPCLLYKLLVFNTGIFPSNSKQLAVVSAGQDRWAACSRPRGVAGGGFPSGDCFLDAALRAVESS